MDFNKIALVIIILCMVGLQACGNNEKDYSKTLLLNTRVMTEKDVLRAIDALPDILEFSIQYRENVGISPDERRLLEEGHTNILHRKFFSAMDKSSKIRQTLSRNGYTNIDAMMQDYSTLLWAYSSLKVLKEQNTNTNVSIHERITQIGNELMKGISNISLGLKDPSLTPEQRTMLNNKKNMYHEKLIALKNTVTIIDYEKQIDGIYSFVEGSTGSTN